jgi:hypothetical protein
MQEAKSNGFWIFRKNPLDKFANLKFSVSTGIRGGQQFRHPVVVPILSGCHINKRWSMPGWRKNAKMKITISMDKSTISTGPENHNFNG